MNGGDSTEEAAARVGQTIDRYRLEALIGVGGFGAVYRARHTMMDRCVALKLLHRAGGGGDEERAARFLREAQATVAIRHPSIVQTFDFGVTPGGERFLVMELLEGEDLQARWDRGGLSGPDAIAIMADVLEGLVAAHAAGVVHRDLKPANIFLASDGVKILDFGISKMRTDAGPSLTRTGVVMGTPLYMPPESFQGARDLDARADVYAVGAILYQLLSGRPPHHADTYERLVIQIATQPVRPLCAVAPNVPVEIGAAIDRALAPRERRWADASSFLAALSRQSTPHAAATPARRVLWPLVAAGVAGTVIGVAVALVAWLAPDVPEAVGTKPSVEPVLSGPVTPTVPTGGFGTCAFPLPLTPGERAIGSTTAAPAARVPPCVDSDSPESVHRLDIPTRSQVRIDLRAGYDGVLSLSTGCDPSAPVIACNDDGDGMNHSRIDETLEPGTYFVFVDGWGGERGDYTLEAVVAPIASTEDICANAPMLPLGVEVSGTTELKANHVTPSCGGDPSGPDAIHRLDVAEPSRLRVTQVAAEDGVLSLQAGCGPGARELACSDDVGDSSHSIVLAEVGTGTHYIVADAYEADDAGTYTLTAELVPMAGRDVAGTRCASPGALESGVAAVDTFAATDDFAGTCGGAAAPDMVFAFDVPSRAQVQVQVQDSLFDGAVYVRSACDSAASELLCVTFRSAGGEEEGRQWPSVILAPGRYFAIVDGVGPMLFGRAVMRLGISPL